MLPTPIISLFLRLCYIILMQPSSRLQLDEIIVLLARVCYTAGACGFYFRYVGIEL